MSEPPTLQNQLEELFALPDEESRRNFAARNPSLLRTKVVADLADKVRMSARVDAAQAERMADSARVIAESLNDRESLALALRAKANVFLVQGRNADSVQLQDQALAIFDALGNAHEAARTLSGSIQPLLLQGEYDRAFAAGERARKIFAIEGNTWRLARLDINIGNIYYRQDRFAEALGSYQRAYQGLDPKEDPEGIAAVLSNIATCQISLNSFPKALDAYQRARAFCLEHNMPLLVTQADYNIAYLYYLRGEYGRAIEMLRTTRTNAKKINDSYHHSLCNLDLSELYLELNLSAEAADLAQQGYEGFHKLGMGYESAKCLAFSAMAASQIGHAFQGLESFSKAREIFVKENNRVWPSLIDLYRALVFYNEGRYFEARRLCGDALKSFHLLKMTSKAVLSQLLLARIALKTEELDQAFENADAALKDLSTLEIPTLSFQAHFLMGNIHAAKGDLDGAYDSYQSARKFFETLRSSLRGEELKIAFVKNRLEVYENLVELCLKKSTDVREEAFTYVEQAKSRSLMDLFSRPASSKTESDPGQSELVRSIRELREELNWYYHLIEREQLQPEERSPERIANLQKQASDYERELVRTLQEASESDTAQAGLQAPTRISFEAIRAAIPRDALLVEYFKIRDRFMVCLLGKETFEISSITLESRVSSLLRLFQFQLSKFRLDPKYLEIFQASLLAATQSHLQGLYQELIAPVASRLTAKHLIFVPHGLLHYVPFHALHDGVNYVIDRYTVSYTPSASIYALSQTRAVNSTGPSLVLGVPDVQAPAILNEVETLKDTLDQAHVFIGPAVTEQVLRDQGASSRIIHIATHGRFRQDNPMFSSIRLGDSFLSLYDLYQMKLPAELITLSGCSTGLNVIAEGDELIGLARGLLQAGAQSLVLSLWDVHDKSTAEFMKTFYKLLQQGESKASALRAAMIQVRSSYPHPYQWAPFILAGKG